MVSPITLSVATTQERGGLFTDGDGLCIFVPPQPKVPEHVSKYRKVMRFAAYQLTQTAVLQGHKD